MVKEMDAASDIEGGCVCGDVRFIATTLPLRVTICHCTWCQRRTGSAFGVECVFQLDKIKVEGSSLRSYRHTSDISGRWLEQAFCSSCGSNIGLRLEALPDIRSISIGCFDSKAWMDNPEVMVKHVFTRSKLDFSEIPDNVETHEMHFRK